MQSVKILFLLIAVIFHFQCHTDLFTIRSIKTSSELFLNGDQSNYDDCKILDQRSVVNFLFVVALNRWNRSPLSEKQINFSNVKFQETFTFRDLGISFLGFLFSFISTTETYFGCGYAGQENSLVADMPKIKIIKQPTALTTVSFANSSSVVTPSESNRLKLISAQLLKSQVKLLLVGSADSTGDRSQNLILAQNRAESVKNEFIKLGLDENRIYTMSNLESEKGIFKDSVFRGVILFILEFEEN
ncbi:OmpA family protein [Leptospira sp. GIMC2001]|uniref:OmpA family protein n=1 Tax=Leptospira sp. GIMC2001 TaxID=1513297 RepID=UPI00234ACF5B|nr:OmpA family protein [Leptospira sp. GIMC2001]WCL48484.1 OmpA family protein [Leptospira sp. GIMC2001]